MARQTANTKSKAKGSAKAAKAAGGSASDRFSSESVLRRIAWMGLAGVILFLLATLISFDPADSPSHAVSVHNNPPANWCGLVGAYIAYWAYQWLGHGLWLGMGMILVYLGWTATGRPVSHSPVRLVGLVTMVWAVSGLQHLWLPTSGAFPEGGGGVIAIAGVDLLVARFNAPGTTLILLMLFAIGSVITIDQVVVRMPLYLLRTMGLIRRVPVGKALGTVGRMAGAARLAASQSADEREIPLRVHGEDYEGKRKKKKNLLGRVSPDAGGLGGVNAFDPEDEAYDNEEETTAPAKSGKVRKVKSIAASVSVETNEIDMEALREKVRKLPVNFASKKAAKPVEETDLPRSQDYSDYQFPPIQMLLEPEGTFSEQIEEYVREQAEALEHALRVYGIDGEVVGIDSGPVIALFEVQLAPGTKVSSVNAVSSDLARALRAQNIRVVPNMAGKTTVGIEVPNVDKEQVRIRELMGSPKAAAMKLPMFLGKDASGTPLIQDLASMPHMLIAGTTGSGKSVCMNTIIMSFLYTKRPDELKLILVDPKMVEMSQFRDIPHLMCPVVTEMPKAAAILEWAVTKMEERYEILAEVGVRDVPAYNRLGWEEISERLGPMTPEEEAKIPKTLPYIVFIIDELADLIMTNKETETFIVRIAQKARAVGIHLILATQRPQANVVTGLIKSNMPCRISFKVASGMDSRIVLDQKGAELLLGQGDMLFLSPRSSELVRAQGTMVDDTEIRKAVRFLKDVAAPSFERQLMVLGASTSEGEGGELNASERDPLFFDAVGIIVESGRGSVSLLQRRLAIGYTRASRLVDQMGIAGILGEHKGSVAREVLVSLEEWEQMHAMMEKEEAEGTLFGTEEKTEPDHLDPPVAETIARSTSTLPSLPVEDKLLADEAEDEEDEEYEDEDEEEDGEEEYEEEEEEEEEAEDEEDEYEYVDEYEDEEEDEDDDEEDEEEDGEAVDEEDEGEWEEEEEEEEEDEEDLSYHPRSA